jgi:two-component system sensor histidine kinase CiaH
VNQAAPNVRSISIRVALAAAAVVGAVYLLIAVAVVVVVTNNLTAQIDQQLAGYLERIGHEPRPSEGGQVNAPLPDRPFGPVLLVWTVGADGSVASNTANADLPADYARVTEPQTVAVAGTQVRIAGAPMGPGHVVVGQTLESVSQARSSLIATELFIAPGLLSIVFLGAVAIGRRVASPIERARQRQMEFTADASHELRTPLSVIEANASLALAQERDVGWYQGAFERVDGESRRMRRLLDDLLWLARFDAGQGAPRAEPVDLGVLAAQTCDRFGAVAEARNLTLTAEVGSGPNAVSAPAEWLDRLLGVLLDNACRYSPEGGSVHVTVAPTDGRVSLTVDDSGPGIPPDQRDGVFDRFHRATETPGGAGLGLSIADAIVRATGGRWRIGTAPQGGASMTVSWPRAR